LKILVLSDSHGRKSFIHDAVAGESPDWILHLGDNDKDCSEIIPEFPEIPLRTVRGNCDVISAGLDMDEFILEGKRIFMTHGHLFGVKTGKTNIVNTAKSRNADILLFGHTHIPHYSVMDNLSMINPGSIGKGDKSYAVLKIKNGVVKCKLKKL